MNLVQVSQPPFPGLLQSIPLCFCSSSRSPFYGQQRDLLNIGKTIFHPMATLASHWDPHCGFQVTVIRPLTISLISSLFLSLCGPESNPTYLLDTFEHSKFITWGSPLATSPLQVLSSVTCSLCLAPSFHWIFPPGSHYQQHVLGYAFIISTFTPESITWHVIYIFF